MGVAQRAEKRVELERDEEELRKEWKEDMWQSQLSGFPAMQPTLLFRSNIKEKTLTCKVYLANVLKTCESIFLHTCNIIVHDGELY